MTARHLRLDGITFFFFFFGIIVRRWGEIYWILLFAVCSCGEMEMKRFYLFFGEEECGVICGRVSTDASAKFYRWYSELFVTDFAECWRWNEVRLRRGEVVCYECWKVVVIRFADVEMNLMNGAKFELWTWRRSFTRVDSSADSMELTKSSLGAGLKNRNRESGVADSFSERSLISCRNLLAVWNWRRWCLYDKPTSDWWSVTLI